MAEFKLATEVVDSPSKGYLYSKDSPLAEGKIEIKYIERTLLCCHDQLTVRQHV